MEIKVKSVCPICWKKVEVVTSKELQVKHECLCGAFLNISTKEKFPATTGIGFYVHLTAHLDSENNALFWLELRRCSSVESVSESITRRVKFSDIKNRRETLMEFIEKLDDICYGEMALNHANQKRDFLGESDRTSRILLRMGQKRSVGAEEVLK